MLVNEMTLASVSFQGEPLSGRHCHQISLDAFWLLVQGTQLRWNALCPLMLPSVLQRPSDKKWRSANFLLRSLLRSEMFLTSFTKPGTHAKSSIISHLLICQ